MNLTKNLYFFLTVCTYCTVYTVQAVLLFNNCITESPECWFSITYYCNYENIILYYGNKGEGFLPTFFVFYCSDPFFLKILNDSDGYAFNQRYITDFGRNYVLTSPLLKVWIMCT